MNDVKLSTTQVEEMTGINRDRISRMCKRGLIPHTIVQNKNRNLFKIFLSDIDKVVDADKKYAKASPTSRLEERVATLESLVEKLYAELAK